MISLLSIVFSGAALLIMIPVLVLFCEVVAAGPARASGASRNPKVAHGKRPSLAILMPAHDEQLVIAETLRTVVPQLESGDRLVVVADNCSDNTAEIAIAHGGEVIVRRDVERRGKGYALDFGMQHLKSAAPEVVLIIDADCQVGAGAIDRLARLSAATSRPVQALYLMRSGENPDLKTRIAEFAWVVKNQVRPTGLLRLGMPCQLMGTGMAFPWASISRAPLASGHIVEDLKLGLDLACSGAAPLFCPEALVESYFPTSNEGLQSQRTRWEHGHLGVILSEAPRLLVNAISTLNASTLALAVDLSVPPLALLTLLLMAVGFASVIFWIVTRAPLPLELVTVTGLLFAVAVFLSWHRYARHLVSLGSLFLAILHAFLKIPLYLKFLVARQAVWVRSKRDQE